MTNSEKVRLAVAHCLRSNDISICEACPYNVGNDYGCRARLRDDIVTLLKAQEAREITKKEWKQWKKTPDGKRDPLYFMWIDCAPGLWITSPERIDEVAYLTGEIKIWNKKPSDDVMMKIQQDTWTQQGK